MALTRFKLQQILSGIVMPPLPPYPVSIPVLPYAMDMDEDELISAIINMGTINNMVMPFAMKLPGEAEYWTLPVEPMLSLSGKNILVRRNVAKVGESKDVRGTVKERWSTDDYTIQLIGQLRNYEDDAEYPRQDVERLRRYCESREIIQVQCPLLEIFNITQMAIESYEIPFTKGEDMQAYTITAYSDALFELLIDTE